LPRYHPLKRRVVIKLLESYGFKFDRVKGDHAQYEHVKFRGKRRLVTVPFYDEFNPKGDVLKGIFKQAGISKKEFYQAAARL
jgi:predicted RNA binding protein YcfA (HicA-like mRNA interferase family)